MHTDNLKPTFKAQENQVYTAEMIGQAWNKSLEGCTVGIKKLVLNQEVFNQFSKGLNLSDSSKCSEWEIRRAWDNSLAQDYLVGFAFDSRSFNAFLKILKEG